MLLLDGVPFEKKEQIKMQKEYEDTLEDLIIDVASLCCEEDTRSLLDKAGIDISEEYNLQRRYEERTMDRVSPEKEI